MLRQVDVHPHAVTPDQISEVPGGIELLGRPAAGRELVQGVGFDPQAGTGGVGNRRPASRAPFSYGYTYGVCMVSTVVVYRPTRAASRVSA
ncbi:hypothetical protein Cme02nite_55830 [Catellatospora methionotrophica]|uniref:Uncharacterized protein n=1 Tax=Catellatospora methionotrophica TaxID=121620 RepID=A0A8J3PGX9_9ACTN|nr:hypothetical protein Cme02nite_55830 [Catellatospora methionotrophica]